MQHFVILYGSEHRVFYVKNKCKWNIVGMVYLRTVHGKARRDCFKNEWMMLKWRSNTEVSDQYKKKSTLEWFSRIDEKCINEHLNE